MRRSVRSLLRKIDKRPLSEIFPTVIRMAKSSGNPNLEKWSRLELHGYWNTNEALTDEVVVPEYRTVPGQWLDDFGRVLLIDQPGLEFLNEMRLRQGVLELEGWIGADGAPEGALAGFC